MAAAHASLLFLTSLCLCLLPPTHSLACSSQKLPDSRIRYPNCTDLPTLNSTLHYSYDATNSSLSVAFVSAPPTPDGWVAWGINPSGTGMVGAQALIAHLSNGAPVVRTYNLTSYGFINESRLSFDAWNLSATQSGGSIVIYATVKVPASAEREGLNQVWQVGPTAAGHPAKHEMRPANLGAKAGLALAASSVTPAAAPGPASGRGSSNGTNSGMWIRPGKMGLWAGALVLFGSWGGRIYR